MKHGILTMALVALIAMNFLSPALADPGDLDTTFGAGGKVITPFNLTPLGADFIFDMVIQPDGKIIAGGQVRAAVGHSTQIALARYDTAGNLDGSFGSGGKVTFLFEGGNQVAGIKNLALQPDGKILAVSTVFGPNIFPFPRGDFAVWRFNPDGSLDSTFSGDGMVSFDFNPGGFPVGDAAKAVALQGDGKIVVAGNTAPRQGSFDFTLARLNADGTLDLDFGTRGRVRTDLGFNLSEQVEAMFIQPDGKIVLVGWILRGFPAGADAAMVRYNTDGTLDAGFGSGGIVITDIAGGSEFGNNTALQSDGKILLVGASRPIPTTPDDFLVVRYNSDGSLDPTFGTGGYVLTQHGSASSTARDVVLQPNGKIVIAGSTNPPLGGLPDYAVVRYNSDGSLDTDFGVGGVVMTDFLGTMTIDGAQAVSLQTDGKIVASGFTFPPGLSYPDWSLARYEGGELNEPPLANAGPDQMVDENTLVTLDGSGSSDPDSDPLSYSWTQVGGPAVLLSDPTTEMPTFTAPDVTADTVLTFELIVNDGTVDSDPDTVTITVLWVPTPAELSQDLIDTVISFDLPAGLTNSLLAKLNAVLAKIETNPDTACNNLDSFINQVQAQSGKKIDEGQATLVIILANDIKALLGC